MKQCPSRTRASADSGEQTYIDNQSADSGEQTYIDNQSADSDEQTYIDNQSETSHLHKRVHLVSLRNEAKIDFLHN